MINARPNIVTKTPSKSCVSNFVKDLSPNSILKVNNLFKYLLKIDKIREEN
ncbi:MAG: hypothetical protein PUJ51_00080 [Clostridiales bacterium]|nr:hypothetical protein [Clostridiales bacterium]